MNVANNKKNHFVLIKFKNEILSEILQAVRCHILGLHEISIYLRPASVAQLDACPTGEQEVAGSTPAGSATFFHGDLIMKYFLRSFSPFR